MDGAVRYRLTVLDAELHAVWSWEGAETEARIGDRPLDDTNPGGALSPVGGTWRVTALDRESHAIATSEARSLGT